jgi:hypothetical protein
MVLPAVKRSRYPINKRLGGGGSQSRSGHFEKYRSLILPVILPPFLGFTACSVATLLNELSLSIFTKNKGREMLRKQERDGRVDDTTATRHETNYINSERKSKVGDPPPQYQIHRRMGTEQVSLI